MSNDTAQSAEQWLAKANEDWEAVQILSAHPNPPRSLVCFHCQQYVEKLLKALLTLNGIEAPRTHNLRRLIQLTERFAPRLALLIDFADALSAHGVQSRYPDESYVVDNTEMRRMTEVSQEFADALLPVLKEIPNK
jgi:HEPN domain-containing protein